MTSPADLARPDLDQARAAYDALVAQGMKLDLTRGKPSAAQLDLAAELLHLPADQYKAADGTDTRNYGGLQGLPELREIFAPVLQVPAEQLIAFGNGSLELMHDTLVNALLNAMPGSPRRWVEEERVVFLAPVPGYDRHFGVCERLGIELVPVPLTDDGPDMDEVERLVAADPAVKGIWCVPKYSNPTGACTPTRRSGGWPPCRRPRRTSGSCGTTRTRCTRWPTSPRRSPTSSRSPPRRATPTACSCSARRRRSPSRARGWRSSARHRRTSRGGWRVTSKRTIGPDKTNHLRHVMFLRDTAGVAAHMAKHRAIIAPKFAALERILTENFADTPGVSWSTPEGGYFVTLRVPDGCASEVVRLAKEAGIALTPAGATHPYGKDPEDAIIRLAPTFPVLDEVEKAMAGVAVCVKLALAQR